jgi:VWFA-related protein
LPPPKAVHQLRFLIKLLVMKVRATLLSLVVAVSWAGIFAQSAPTNAGEQTPVSLSIFVTDAHDNPVSAISTGDVSIMDDYQRPRTVIAATRDESPLRLGVVIDASKSQSKSELYKAGIQELNALLEQVLRRNADEAFVETFDTDPHRPTPCMRIAQLKNAGINLQTGNASALFDAIEVACKERFTDNTSPARRVLILLTDGEDNASRISLDAAILAAQRTRTAIIAISTLEESWEHADSVLRQLAEETGGYAFLGLSPKKMPMVFSKIASQLDSMVQVTYVPARSAKAGDAHQLQIKSASGRKLRVRAPKRYYVVTP